MIRLIVKIFVLFLMVIIKTLFKKTVTKIGVRVTLLILNNNILAEHDGVYNFY